MLRECTVSQGNEGARGIQLASSQEEVGLDYEVNSPLSVDGVFRTNLVTGDLSWVLFRTALANCKVTEEWNGEVIPSGGSICHYLSRWASNVHLTVSSDSAVYTSLQSTSGKCGDLVDPKSDMQDQ